MSQTILYAEDFHASFPLVWDESTPEISIAPIAVQCTNKAAGTTDALTVQVDPEVGVKFTLDHSKFWQKTEFESSTEFGSFIGGLNEPVSILSDTFNILRVLDPEGGDDVGLRISCPSDDIVRITPLNGNQWIRFQFNSATDRWQLEEYNLIPLDSEDIHHLGSDNDPFRNIHAVQFRSTRWAVDTNTSNSATDDRVFESPILIQREWDANDIENLTFPPFLHFDLTDNSGGAAQPVIRVSVDGNSDVSVDDRFWVDTFGDVYARKLFVTDVLVSSDPWSGNDDFSVALQILEPISAMTGTSDSLTTLNTATVTLELLARRVKYLQETMASAGLLASAGP